MLELLDLIEEEDVKSIVEKWCRWEQWKYKMKCTTAVSAKASTFCSIAANESYGTALSVIKFFKDNIKPSHPDMYNIKVIVYGHMLVTKQISQEDYNNHMALNILENC